MNSTRASASRFTWLVAVVCLIAWVAPAVLIAQGSGSTCPFCRSEQADEAYICTHCGRMFRVANLKPEHRFWGDAFYIYSLPTITSRPDLIAEVGPDGLIREQAKFDLGDHYEFEVTNEGAQVSAAVYSRNQKEVGYKATIEDGHDEAGRLATRIIHGELRSKPKRFLYRKIVFKFDGDRFDSAEVGSWIYSSARDWEKRPTKWIRHTVMNVRFEYLEGLLSRIHAARKKGVRDLRGNADYAAEEGFSETVDVVAGVVTGFGPPELSQGDPQ